MNEKPTTVEEINQAIVSLERQQAMCYRKVDKLALEIEELCKQREHLQSNSYKVIQKAEEAAQKVIKENGLNPNSFSIKIDAV